MRINLRILPVVTLGLVLSGAWGYGQSTLEEVVPATMEDLRRALDGLAELRDKITEEKIPLAEEANRLEEELIAQRKAMTAAQRERDNQLVELNVTKSEVQARNDEKKYLLDLLGEYTRLFETRIHISELQKYKSLINEAKQASENPDVEIPEKFERQVDLVDASLDRLGFLLGGEIFSGKALVPSGVMESGRYVLAGPVAFFSSEESEAAGIATLEFGSPEPTITDLGAELNSDIRTLIAEGEGKFPLDPTDGTALQLENVEDTLFEHLLKGGPVMVPILLAGIVALVICVVKWMQISRIRTVSNEDLRLVVSRIRNNESEKAKAHARSIRGPIGEMLATAVDHCQEKKEYIEEVMYERMLSAKPQLERMLPIIALAAATAPLLGLLGTVTGMINTFNMITVFGTGDPKMLAGGISEALITTKFGLIVAVPSLLMHAFVSRKAKGVLSNMEATAVGFINGIPQPEEERNDYAGNVFP